MASENGAPIFCIAGSASEGAAAGCALSARLAGLAEARGWHGNQGEIRQHDEIDEGTALVFSTDAGADTVRRAYPHALLISDNPMEGMDLVCPKAADEAALIALLEHGENHWRRNLKVMLLFRELGARQQRMGQLSDIALSLSTEMEYSDLLETILLEARRLAGCDAGSLYLLDESGDEPELVFKLTQNDSREFPFAEQRLPLTADSLAGYVALMGDELDIPDVYKLPKDAPYKFNRSFDDQNNYRSVSMLVLPMRDHRGKVVGVLQLLKPSDQEILMLAAWEELTAPEVAVVLGISTSAAEQRIHRAKRRFAAKMERKRPNTDSLRAAGQGGGH